MYPKNSRASNLGSGIFMAFGKKRMGEIMLWVSRIIKKINIEAGTNRRSKTGLSENVFSNNWKDALQKEMIRLFVPRR